MVKRTLFGQLLDISKKFIFLKLFDSDWKLYYWDKTWLKIKKQKA